MELVSLSFFYIFLPVCISVYFLAPRRLRPAALLFVSLIYYLFAQPKSVPLMAITVLLDFVSLRIMSREKASAPLRRGCLWFSVVKNLLVLFWAGASVQIRPAEAVLGVAVYCLSGIDCVASVYRRETPAVTSPVRFGLYCLFFPRLYQGPLLTYGEFDSHLDAGPRPGPLQILDGLCRMLLGAVKILLPGRYLSLLYVTLRAYSADASILSRWCMVLVLALTTFYRLSGYCDMAVGLGGVFGLRLPQNFYYPYQSRSVQDFFQRFLVTVSGFYRRLFYGGQQDAPMPPAADANQIIVIGMLLGLWFGMSAPHMMWGIFLAAFAVMERRLYPNALERIPTLFRRMYTLLVVLVSFALLAGDSPTQSLRFVADLTGLTGLVPWNNQILYLLSTNWLLLLIGCFFATNICSLLITTLRRAVPKWMPALLAAADGVLLLLVTGLLIG